MNTTGTIRDAQRDIKTGKIIISFIVDTTPDFDALNGLLDISAKKHREKRSLNANSYFHVLVDKIAKATRSSAIEVKNGLLRDYGQLDYLPNGALNWSVKPESFDYLKSETEHLRPSGRIVKDKGKNLPIYFVIRGSHTYNTEEMSILIDATVQEAKELGIEVLPPKELERMKRLWSSTT